MHHPTASMFPHLAISTTVGPVVIALSALLAPVASAQVSYVEGPDLSENLNFPTPVGTAATGLNTVRGSVSATFDAFGIIQGDGRDAFSFVVPGGLAVTGIQCVVSNFAATNTSGSISSGASVTIGSTSFVANGTYTLPLSGPLGAGTYGILSSGFVPFDRAGSFSFTYEVRITAVVPTNDLCIFATPVALGSIAFNSTGATTDGPPHPTECTDSGDPQIGSDLWYIHTPAQSGLLTVATCGSMYDTKLAVYTGSCTTLATTLLACNNDNAAACGSTFFGSRNSQVVIPVAAGQAYRIRVGGLFSAVGPGTLTLSLNTTGACCNGITGACVVLSQADCQTAGSTFLGFASVCSPMNCNPCPADFNQDTALTAADIFDFLNAWFADPQDPRANFDGVGGIDAADIFAFLNAWFAGC